MQTLEEAAIPVAAEALDTKDTQPAAPEKLYRLDLDADGVYFGASEVHPDDVREGDIVLAHVPDNPTGKYRWDRNSGAMMPLPVDQQKVTREVPDLQRAFADLCQALADQGTKLPQATAEWMQWYATTIDTKKSVA